MSAQPRNPLKMKKKPFVPVPRDVGDEFYPNGLFEFNITKLIALIRKNPSQFSVEQVSLEGLPQFTSTRLNEAMVEAANLAVPIILGEISPGRFNVIDGNHRGAGT